MRRAAIVLLATLWVTPALAGTGKTLINQARALAGGVTAGDAPGFPITISASGAYQLTSNLVPTNQNVNAIEITASNVSIDMNYFFILGGGTCTIGGSGWVTGCTNTGTGNGIVSDQSNIGIADGAIFGMGSLAIDMDSVTAAGFRLEGVSVAFCGGGGISLGRSAYLLDVFLGWNLGDGITLADGGRLVRSISGGNAGEGLSGTGSGRVVESEFNQNSGDGIEIGANATVRGNRTIANGGAGIDVGYASSVIDNISNYNGTYGVVLGALAGTSVGYGNNVFNGNTTAQISGTGTQLGSNVCGTGPCP
jgi:hypothetical protein